MGTNGVSFDARYAAYEKYLKSAVKAERISLAGTQLGEQLGRYSLALQNDEIKKQNKEFGRQYARELAVERSSKAATPATHQANTTATAVESAVSQKNTAAAVVENEESQLHNVKKLKKSQKKAYKEAEKTALNEKIAANKAAIKERLAEYAKHKGEVSGVVKADRIAEEKIAALNRQAEQAAANSGPSSSAPEKGSKHAEKLPKQGKKGGFLSKIGKAMKGKKGKAGLIVGLVAAAGAGLYALFKSDKSDMPETVESNEQTVVVPQEVPEENEESALQPVAEQPVAEQDETSAAQPVAGKHTVDSDENTYTVKEGDNVWNIAKAHLKEFHKSEPDYVPTNKEILKHTQELLELNNLHYEADGYRVIIRPDDKLKLVA